MAQIAARVHRNPCPRLDAELTAPRGATAGRAGARETVTAAAVWRPDAGFLARLHVQCDSRAGPAFDACFAAAMAQAGASTAALEFTRRLGNTAYLEALAPTPGPIAVAHVVYPFRANENDGWLLVNGAPPMIDIDDPHLRSLAPMRAEPAYAEIERRYPNVTFWPGERGAAGPEVSPDGREIIAGYLLRDQCHACAIVGRVRFAVDFNAAGKFIGTRLVSVMASAN